LQSRPEREVEKISRKTKFLRKKFKKK